MASPIAVAVIGAGAFGRNHLRVYRELQRATPDLVRLAACVDPSSAAREHVAKEYGIAVFATTEELLATKLALQAASICVPTVQHATVAEQLLRAGFDVLIEKPIAASLDESQRIITLADSLKRIVQIGHLERFNPAVKALSENIKRPMFFECHRLSIFTPRALDVDVVLDLMIHDLDIVLSLAQSGVREVRAVGLPVLSGKVDIANVRVEFESGCVANFTASRISTERVRKLRLFQEHQYWSLDFARQDLFVIEVDPSAAKLIAMAAAAGLPPSGAMSLDKLSLPQPSTPDLPVHPTAGLSLRKFDTPHAEPLSVEIQDFLQAVNTRTQPRVTAHAGHKALDLALQINQEIAAHAKRAGI
jgi:predicted dehydrogenase